MYRSRESVFPKVAVLTLLTVFWFSCRAQTSLNPNGTQKRPEEVKALLDIRDKLTLFPGRFLPSWNTTTQPDVCKWDGISCGKRGFVKYISVSNPNLGGSLSPSIGNLTKLRGLDLHGCSLGGRIPNEVASVPTLAFVELQANNLVGSIPAGFGRSSLILLKLYTNQLSGPLPADLWNAVYLQRLLLQENRLSGTIPETLFNLHQLIVLRLGRNQFSGSLPQAMGNLFLLKYLSINGNLFSGPIPPSIGNLKHVSVVDLSGNQFNGSVPSEIFSMDRVVSLSLANNSLSGELPEGAGNLTRLSILDLSENSFWGPIPRDLGNVSTLSYLDLSQNDLSGDLPDFSKLTSLTYFDLSENVNLGSLQLPSVFNSPGLETLYIHGCNFSGSVPDSLTALKKLTRLNLTDNLLSGPVSAALQTFLSGLDYSLAVPNPNITQSTKWLYALENNCLEVSANCALVGNRVCFLPLQKTTNLCLSPLAADQRDNHALLIALVLGLVLLGVLVAIVAGVVGFIVRLRRDNEMRMPVKSVSVRKGGPIVSMKVNRQQAQQLDDDDEEDDNPNPYTQVEMEGGPSGVSGLATRAPTRNPIGVPEVTLADLRVATEDFSELLTEVPNLGKYYSGTLKNGKKALVLVLAESEDASEPEDYFLATVLKLYRLQHLHLATLLAYCYDQGTRALITEYVSGGTLFDRLHVNREYPLTWRERMRIAVGVAGGLDYLHNIARPSESHGDLKASNVRLTADLAAKLCDFSMDKEKLIGKAGNILDPAHPNSSFGYLDPEYVVDHGGLTDKSDVYSFGVLLYELLSGQKALNDDCIPLMSWVRQYMTLELLPQLVDPVIREQVPQDELETIVDLAQACTWPSKVKRPSIREVRAILMEKLGISESSAAPDMAFRDDEEIVEFPESEVL